MTKILLVEDDKSLREIYGARLFAEKYDIVSAGDGEEALAVAIREQPDLIISDVMMPKISGFEMLDLLRGNDSTKNIKVIMMTALSSDQQRDRGEKLGADRYLVKSQVGIEDLVQTVHDVLGDRNATAAAGNPANQVVSAMPAPNQTPVNPPAATRPSAVAGVPAPTLPPRPMSLPTNMATAAPTTANLPNVPNMTAVNSANSANLVNFANPAQVSQIPVPTAKIPQFSAPNQPISVPQNSGNPQSQPTIPQMPSVAPPPNPVNPANLGAPNLTNLPTSAGNPANQTSQNPQISPNSASQIPAAPTAQISQISTPQTAQNPLSASSAIPAGAQLPQFPPVAPPNNQTPRAQNLANSANPTNLNSQFSAPNQPISAPQNSGNANNSAQFANQTAQNPANPQFSAPQNPAKTNVPSFQPGEGSAAQDKFERGEAAYQPAVDLSQSGGGMAHVVQPPTGAINPKIDINNLLAKEDASAMGLNSANISATNPAPILDEADVAAQMDAANAKIAPANDNPTITFPSAQ